MVLLMAHFSTAVFTPVMLTGVVKIDIFPLPPPTLSQRSNMPFYMRLTEMDRDQLLIKVVAVPIFKIHLTLECPFWHYWQVPLYVIVSRRVRSCRVIDR